MKKLRLIVCVAFWSWPTLAAASNVYVVDFTTRSLQKNALTEKLTFDFELALAQTRCFRVLESRHYGRLLTEIDREKAIADISGLSGSTVQNLKIRQVDSVVFGEVYDDIDSGEVTVTVTFQRWDRTKEHIRAIAISRGKINDAPTRRRSMEQLCQLICPPSGVVGGELQRPVDLEDIHINWGPLPGYFVIQNPEIGEVEQQHPLVGTNRFRALRFQVEARTSFVIAAFKAQFFDSDQIEVEVFSKVEFQPDFSAYQWRPGQRSRAHVLLPLDMSRVAEIRFSPLF